MSSNLDVAMHREVRQLIGLRLTAFADVAGMAAFHFGPLRTHPKHPVTVGSYALHVQCPWRLIGGKQIITSSSDRWIPNGNHQTEWDSSWSSSAQAETMRSLFGAYEDNCKKMCWADAPTVTDVILQPAALLTVVLLTYRIEVFPIETAEESWRLFEPGSDAGHLVIKAGRVQECMTYDPAQPED